MSDYDIMRTVLVIKVMDLPTKSLLSSAQIWVGMKTLVT